MTDLLEMSEDGIAWLTLHRPDRLNAFSPAMLTALGEALQRLGEDPTLFRRPAAKKWPLRGSLRRPAGWLYPV
jgi:hypothetical protein